MHIIDTAFLKHQDPTENDFETGGMIIYMVAARGI